MRFLHTEEDFGTCHTRLTSVANSLLEWMGHQRSHKVRSTSAANNCTLPPSPLFPLPQHSRLRDVHMVNSPAGNLHAVAAAGGGGAWCCGDSDVHGRISVALLLIDLLLSIYRERLSLFPFSIIWPHHLRKIFQKLKKSHSPGSDARAVVRCHSCLPRFCRADSVTSPQSW